MNERKIKILHLFSTLPVGGAEMLMLNIAKNINRQKFKVVVCCLGEEGIIGREIKDLGVEVVSFNFNKIGSLNPGLLFILVSFLKSRKFDIIHTHMYNANYYGRVGALLAGIPVIVSAVHNTYAKRKLHRIIINRILSKITKMVFVGTPAVKEDVNKYDHIPDDKIEILSYGIDTEKFLEKHDRDAIRKDLGLAPGDCIVGNVARLEKAKGQKYLIEAVQILKDKGLNVKCLVVGSGSLEQELRNLVTAKEVEDRVFFLGTRTDLPELFSAMDMFVFPSLWEGLPLSLLSAMAAGLPIITTHAGGIRDVIVDGEDGIVVPGSDASAIAKAIEKVLNDKELRKMLSENARQKVLQYYSAEVMTRNLEVKYEELISC